MSRSGSLFVGGPQKPTNGATTTSHMKRKLGAIDSVTPQTPISITRVRVLGGPLYSDFPPIFSRDPPVFPLPLLTRSMLYTHMSPLLFFTPACAYDPTFPSPSPGLEKRPMCRHPSLPSPAPPSPGLENAHHKSSSSRPVPSPHHQWV